MCKKIAMLGMVGVLGAATLAGTGAVSYMRTGVHSATQAVKNSVPIEWEIKRARQMIDDLKPEIARNMQVVFREKAELDNLAAEIDQNEANLAKSKSQIFRLKNDLEQHAVVYKYGDKTFTEQQVRADLAARFKRFTVAEKTTSKLAKVYEAREANLDAAQRKLDEMLSAKRQLEVEIENLQARLTMVEVAKTSSTLAVDDSQLSNTRQLLDDIRTRISVEENMVASEGVLNGSIPLDEEESPELLDEIADYFGEGRAEVEALVSTNEL